MKKIIASVLALILILALAVSACAEVIDGETYMYIKTNTGKGLRVRSTPDAASEDNIVDLLPYGTRVRVDGYEKNGVWALISFEGARGCYVYTRYLSATNPGKYVPQDDPVPADGTKADFSAFKHITPYQAFVNTSTPTGRVYLRWAPGTAYAYETVCYQGTALTVLVEAMAGSRSWSTIPDT